MVGPGDTTSPTYVDNRPLLANNPKSANTSRRVGTSAANRAREALGPGRVVGCTFSRN